MMLVFVGEAENGAPGEKHLPYFRLRETSETCSFHLYLFLNEYKVSGKPRSKKNRYLNCSRN